ncbi:hypothetical protein M5K25_004639 [Dendrobium thyrsiflorum]|uniref:FHA domain-containing protein n=1 Tax=Dendrobium thyrsiflorum TaxID=117978 RepID=A0ABD0VFJ4_DENTH
MREVFSNAVHKHCLLHLRENFKKFVRQLGIPDNKGLNAQHRLEFIFNLLWLHHQGTRILEIGRNQDGSVEVNVERPIVDAKHSILYTR